VDWCPLMVQLLCCVGTMQNADASVDDCLSSADYSPTFRIVLNADAESTTGPVCKHNIESCVVLKSSALTL